MATASGEENNQTTQGDALGGPGFKTGTGLSVQSSHVYILQSILWWTSGLSMVFSSVSDPEMDQQFQIMDGCYQ